MTHSLTGRVRICDALNHYRSIWVALFSAAAACGPAQRPQAIQPSGPRCVAVVGTNDIHGAIASRSKEYDGTSVRYGGIEGLDAYVDLLREHYDNRVVLVDGGDIYQGSLASNLSEGAAMITALNQMGYHAAAVGNHEFDFGEGKAKTGDPLGVLKERVAQANFPLLTANTLVRKTGEQLQFKNLKPSHTVDVGGLRVGIIGASTEETAAVTRPQNVAHLEFVDPLPRIEAESKNLRDQGAHLIVLVAHIGGKCRDTSSAFDTSSCDPDLELFELLTRIPRGTVDVAVGGHTHSFVAHWVNHIATIEAGAYARQLAWVEACVTGNEARMEPMLTSIHPPTDVCLTSWQSGGCRHPKKSNDKVGPATFLGRPVLPDPQLAASMQPYLAEVENLQGRDTGILLSTTLSRKAKRNNLGELVAEAMAKAAGAPMAVQNRGGVRADLPPGDIPFGKAFEVLPFGNQVVRMKLTGDKLKKFIHRLTSKHQGEPPFLYGLRVKGWTPKHTEVVDPQGRPLDNDTLYDIATSDFLAFGGEGLDTVFGPLTERERAITDSSVLDSMLAHLKQRFPKSSKR